MKSTDQILWNFNIHILSQTVRNGMKTYDMVLVYIDNLLQVELKKDLLLLLLLPLFYISSSIPEQTKTKQDCTSIW